MRMRKKPNLLPRMERAAAVLVTEPEALHGVWRTAFPGFAALHLELGCGKGRFTADTAAADPDTLLVAVEKVPDAMVVAMERAVDRSLHNVKFIDRDVMLLPELFAPGEVSKIYLNFSDPWPKSGHAHRRLTSPVFLKLYDQVLQPEGCVEFKTDNQALFEWSVETIPEAGWKIVRLTRDLHAELEAAENVMTEYEEKFSSRGQKINKLVAVR